MASLKEHLAGLAELYLSVKEKNLTWRERNQKRQQALKKAESLAAQELEAELGKRIACLERDISLLRTGHKAELAMFKSRCEQEVQDYRQFLHAIDDLKKVIQASYAHLPDAVAFTIHHHAKHLLNQMWEAETDEQKRRFECRLIQFMTTAHEEARMSGAAPNAGALPENTLNLIHSS